MQKHPEYKQSIEYTQDFQPLIHAYLFGTPEAASTVAWSLFPSQSATKEGNVTAAENKIKEMVGQLQKLKQNNIRRMVVPLYLGGHYGFAVYDFNTKELVIGEPFGGNSYNDYLNAYEQAIKRQLPVGKIVHSTLPLQRSGDSWNCGRINAKFIAYLATSPLTLSQAMAKNSDTEMFKVANEEDDKKLYQEQCALFDKCLYRTSPANYPALYGPLLKLVGIDVSASKETADRLFKNLHNGFTSGLYFPSLLANAVEAYKSADKETQEKFKKLINKYIEVEIADDEEFEKLFNEFQLLVYQLTGQKADALGGQHAERLNAYFQFAINAMIPELSKNYCKQFLDTAAKTVASLPEGSPSPEKQKLVAKLTSADEVFKKISKAEFLKRYEDQGHKVKFIDNNKAVEIKTNDNGLVKIEKKDKHIEAEAKNPTPSAVEVMADAISQFGAEAEVIIDVKAKNMQSPKVKAIQDQLWLSAMKKGLKPVGYEPDHASQIYQDGLTEKEKYLKQLADKQGETNPSTALGA